MEAVFFWLNWKAPQPCVLLHCRCATDCSPPLPALLLLLSLLPSAHAHLCSHYCPCSPTLPIPALKTAPAPAHTCSLYQSRGSPLPLPQLPLLLLSLLPMLTSALSQLLTKLVLLQLSLHAHACSHYQCCGSHLHHFCFCCSHHYCPCSSMLSILLPNAQSIPNVHSHLCSPSSHYCCPCSITQQ